MVIGFTLLFSAYSIFKGCDIIVGPPLGFRVLLKFYVFMEILS